MITAWYTADPILLIKALLPKSSSGRRRHVPSFTNEQAVSCVSFYGFEIHVSGRATPEIGRLNSRNRNSCVLQSLSRELRSISPKDPLHKTQRNARWRCWPKCSVRRIPTIQGFSRDFHFSASGAWGIAFALHKDVIYPQP